MRALSQAAAYRGVVLLLWALAVYGTATCRGLFWDGSSFLVNILDRGWFHDFYVARSHVDWLTQAPVLALSELGVRDTRLLAASRTPDELSTWASSNSMPSAAQTSRATCVFTSEFDSAGFHTSPTTCKPGNILRAMRNVSATGCIVP